MPRMRAEERFCRAIGVAAITINNSRKMNRRSSVLLRKMGHRVKAVLGAAMAMHRTMMRPNLQSSTG